jgi:hypothetical protein
MHFPSAKEELVKIWLNLFEFGLAFPGQLKKTH